MRLGVAQIRIEGTNPEANRERAWSAIREAVDRGADLVLLPELWRVGYFNADRFEDMAEPLEGPLLGDISSLARELDVAIQAGSIIEDLEQTKAQTPAESGLANTSVLFDRSGKRVAVYRKQHLFGYESREADRLVPGEELGVATVEGITVGITTCYDLRFPELYRDLLDAGVELVLVPSAWPYPRVEYWKTLTNARAIENLFYLAGVNGTGPAGGDGLIGRSRVVDPWGVLLRSAGTTPSVMVVSIDKKRVRAVREEFPALRDRRST